MLNIHEVDMIYLACGYTDLRKSIDGLSIITQSKLQLDPFQKALFIFCNRQMNKLKILHFDEGFWLYYYRLERGKFKWPMSEKEALQISMEDLSWLLKGYEVRNTSKFKPVTERNYY